MSCSSNSVVTNGLIFYHDVNNIKKSYFGGPGTNLCVVDPWTVGGVNTNVSSTSEAGPISNSPTWKFVKTGTSSQWNGWESNYNVFNFTAGEYIAISYWYKTGAAAGISNFNQGSIVTSDFARNLNLTIISNQSSIIADSNWHFNYCVMQVNETYSGGIVADGPSWPYSTSAGVLYINGLTWAKTSYPMQWISGARSNTQVLTDLTGSNVLTASSLTYNSDGSFSFNGSSNMLIFPENSAFNVQSHTVEVWVKTNATTQNGFFFEKGLVNTQYALFQEGSNLTWRHGGQNDLTAPAASYINTSQYAQIVGTYTAGDKRIYVNGVQVASNTFSGTISTNANGCSIGVYGGYSGARGYYYNGKIDILRVYNRALSSDEVFSNFIAHRIKYGI